ncbi:F-box protein CPR1-like [Mercurialis annua]|uniref:F-box protein CPR1-like n=1 Tax=Mercurialis annua TaxID=3986 RepID=UPI00215E3030|nr:F-box protein CPR1-like [Mercurialis annua]
MGKCILGDVLKLLPVKSLLRFRCVSKEFCSLIDSPEFITLNLSQSILTNTDRNLTFFKRDFYTVMDLDSLEYQRDYDCYDNLKNCVIFGSCNGLIALCHPQQGMILWNPSTNKKQTLPHLPDLWGSRRKICCSESLLVGFGYDRVSDDYKVIRIWKLSRREGSRAMVFSVKRKSCRRIEGFPYNMSNPYDLGIFTTNRKCGVLVGSCLHWIVSEPDNSDTRLIVGFNLEDERPFTVPVPDIKTAYEPGWPVELGEVGGCLSVSMLADDGNLLVETWVMKEYGWTKIFSVYRATLKPIGYYKTGNKLLVLDIRSTDLLLYDEEETSPVVPEDRLMRYPMWYYDSFICTRSLVPVDFNAN